jgi:hypothetical protein
MALNVPDEGENYALEAFVGKTAATAPILCLFQSNTTPADTDTVATYTESNFTGYAAITITGASWNNALGGSISYGSQQTFTCSGAASQSVYGYFIKSTTSAKLLWSERDASAPFAIANSGDAVKITPAISAS